MSRQTIGGGDKAKEAAAQNKYEAYKSAYIEVKNGMLAKLENGSITPAQLTSAKNALINWNVSAANPTVARENALYAGLALLYIVVFYLGLKVLKD